jgi:hypothetical protein
MEKYYCIECHTPYCGEDNDYYFTCSYDPNSNEFAEIIDDFVATNATEWWDEDTEENYDSFCDYFADCYFSLWEITKEEYVQEQINKEEKEPIF